MYSPVTLSLFSGAGGLDIGFHNAGFKIIACVDKESICCDSLLLNVGQFSEPDCQIINCDIKELQPEKITTKKIDFIIGGPPCQSFSAIGRRAGGSTGISDERGSLFEHYCRLVQHFQPDGFLFENVRGILGSNKGQDWKRIIQAFLNLNYQISYRILNSADYGVPQLRERLIMVGVRNGCFHFPKPIYGPDSFDKKPYISALDAIMDLQDPNEPTHSYPGKYGKLLEQVPPGMNYHFFTKELGHPNPIFAWRSRFSDFLYKAHPNEPVRTIVAKLGAYSGPFHWKNRHFTINEFRRLQSFPDSYKLAGSTSQILQQIGNSVAPKFSEHLAITVLQEIFNAELNIDLLKTDENLSFDARKSTRAKNTRNKRIKENKNNSLFDNVVLPKEENIQESFSRFWAYSGYSSRKAILDFKSNENLQSYIFEIKRDGYECEAKVFRQSKDGYSENKMAKITVSFHETIGKGIRKISSTIFSFDDKDFTVAWDAIEDCLHHYSTYHSIMDVYGHFTEPHPIFNLQTEIFVSEPTPILKFAKRFSDFNETTKLLHSDIIEDLFKNNDVKKNEFLETVKLLRKLRFDVRVHQTNKTIPLGFFRCCYPFTININKQVSVTWRQI